MKTTTTLPICQIIRAPSRCNPLLETTTLIRCLHTAHRLRATALPDTAAGPPPSPPVPAASQYGERVDRRRRQAELLKRGQEMRASQAKPGNAMKKRFWKEVSVKTAPGIQSSNAYRNHVCVLYLLNRFSLHR